MCTYIDQHMGSNMKLFSVFVLFMMVLSTGCHHGTKPQDQAFVDFDQVKQVKQVNDIDSVVTLDMAEFAHRR